MYGIKSFGAIVNSPQAGILAVGEIADRPVVKDGQVVPGKLMEMTLSCDHRILYGADGAEFLAEIQRIPQDPPALSLKGRARSLALRRLRSPAAASRAPE